MPETLDLFGQAEEKISSSFGRIIKKSSLYKSSSWGFKAENDFFNQVIEVETVLQPKEQIYSLLNIEKSLGRQRKDETGYVSRSIDIDILFIDDLIIETPELTVPHPRLHLRRFTLVPLNEKWSGKIHPLFNKTIDELLNGCSDEALVIKFATI